MTSASSYLLSYLQAKHGAILSTISIYTTSDVCSIYLSTQAGKGSHSSLCQKKYFYLRTFLSIVDFSKQILKCKNVEKYPLDKG